MIDIDAMDIEIKKMGLEHDIAAYRAQILDRKRKLMQIRKDQVVVENQMKDLEEKIQAKEEEYTTL